VSSDGEDYIVGGDNLTLTCRVGFIGPYTPYIQWQLDDKPFIYRASQFTDTDDQSYPGMSKVRVSELDIIVPDCAAYLPKYTCRIQTYAHFYYSSAGTYSYIYLQPVYEWSTPRIKVSCKYKTVLFDAL